MVDGVLVGLILGTGARDILLPKYLLLKNPQLLYRLYQPYITSLQDSGILLYLL